ncbi:M23 family metallopeptidase [Chloroflexi bacterium TSY]|nr:M23 family metallopeptidase [Chloroflexi bacterium TSY]
MNKVEYALPFSGEWFVYNGGTTPDDSHSWDTLTQRYAYDFVIVDDQLRRHVSTGTDLEDYYCYGKEILAVADGKVVKVVDEIRAAPFVGYGIVDFMTRNFIGNHIIIQHAESEYALYAHLIKGAIVVKIGDPVKQGQVIGRCGHSGHSSEPHLHFHLQDRMNFYLALGLPIRFSNIIVNGKTAEGTNIRAGHHVQNPATYHHSLCEHSHG